MMQLTMQPKQLVRLWKMLLSCVECSEQPWMSLTWTDSNKGQADWLINKLMQPDMSCFVHEWP